ncbi:MAG: glycosyltransferase [Paludibacter sp.]|nr:glycosyltransferase [Paludibacter sp.]
MMIPDKKVLLLDTTLHHKDATGITLSNLFGAWSKDDLYMIGTPDRTKYSNEEGYHNTFDLGDNEIKHRFPLNLVKLFFSKFTKNNNEQAYVILGSYIVDNSDKKNLNNRKRNSVKNGFIKKVTTYFQLFGLDLFFFRYFLSDDLKRWIKEADPDYLYAVLSTRHSIRFARDVVKEFNIPLVIHIMDDWPAVIGTDTLFPVSWNKIVNKEFKQLVDISYRRLAISEKMASEYKTRFGGEWDYFHNPVDVEFWGCSPKLNYKAGEPFEILYSGRISQGIIETLKKVAECIEELVVENGFNIILRIQSNNKPEWLNFFNNSHFSYYIEYNQLPELFSHVDVLLLPYDFVGSNFNFIRLSMPTKVSEYMISGTPILIVSPENTALTSSALKENWGYVIKDNEKTKIKNGIIELYSNEELRVSIGTNALNIAKQEHNIVSIQHKFMLNFQ